MNAIRMATSNTIDAGDPTDEGESAIAKWLGPLRDLAITQLRTQSEPVDEEESHRALSRAHIRAQVENVNACSVIREARADGRQIEVHGWCVRVSSSVDVSFF